MERAHEIASKLGRAMGGVRAGSEKLASRKLARDIAPTIRLMSTAFDPDQTLPKYSTVDGSGTPPPLAWTGVPEGAQSLVLFVEDPDAPFPEPYVHWLVYGIPATQASLGDVRAPAYQGKNSKLEARFTPAAPPPGHGLHHYHFQLFALDRASPRYPDAGRGALLHAMQGHVLAWGELIGTYERA